MLKGMERGRSKSEEERKMTKKIEKTHTPPLSMPLSMERGAGGGEV